MSRILPLTISLVVTALTSAPQALADPPRLRTFPLAQASSSWDHEKTGQQGSLAVGPDGDFHLTYWLFDTGAVHYRNWSLESGLSEPVQIATPLDQLNAPPSIAVDPRGTVHVAFVSEGNQISYTSKPRNGTFRGLPLFQNGNGLAQVSIAAGGTIQRPRVGLAYLSRTDAEIDTVGAFEVIYAEKNNALVGSGPWTTTVLHTAPNARCTPTVVIENTAQQIDRCATVAFVGDHPQSDPNLQTTLQWKRGDVFSPNAWSAGVIDSSAELAAFKPTISLRLFPDQPGLVEVGYGKGSSVYTKLGGQSPQKWFDYTESHCSTVVTAGFGDLGGLTIDIGQSCTELDALVDVNFVQGATGSHVLWTSHTSSTVRPGAPPERRDSVYYVPPSGGTLPLEEVVTSCYLGGRTRLPRIAINEFGRVGMIYGRENSSGEAELVIGVTIFDHDDMDGDGATALYEDAMGTSDEDPSDSYRWGIFPDTATIWTGTAPFFRQVDVPAMTFQRRIGATVNADGSFENFEGLRCIPEVSQDLNTWLGGSALFESSETFPNILRPGWEFVTYSWPNGTVPEQAFFHLRAERAD